MKFWHKDAVLWIFGAFVVVFICLYIAGRFDVREDPKPAGRFDLEEIEEILESGGEVKLTFCEGGTEDGCATTLLVAKAKIDNLVGEGEDLVVVEPELAGEWTEYYYRWEERDREYILSYYLRIRSATDVSDRVEFVMRKMGR